MKQEYDTGNIVSQGRTAEKAAGFLHSVTTAKGIKERLLVFGLSPNKALGQNFLADTAIRDSMVRTMPPDIPVYEIGPGLGALTEGLLLGGRPVLAVEKDANMVKALEELLPCGNLTLQQGDALKADLSQIASGFGGEGFWVAGNLPYYITTPLALRLVGAHLPIAGMTLMVQQEAAARFLAESGAKTYGPLAVMMKLAFTCEKLCTLPPSSFYPQPDVYSTVILAKGDGQRIPPGFGAFLSGIFGMRRKTICNNLLQMGCQKEYITQVLKQNKIDPAARAEALPPDALLELFTAFTLTR